jgi:hypothetical protein
VLSLLASAKISLEINNNRLASQPLIKLHQIEEIKRRERSQSFKIGGQLYIFDINNWDFTF